MRLLFVTDTLAKGGKERRMLELLKALSSSGEHEIRLLSLSETVEYEIIYQLPVTFEIIRRERRLDLRVIARLYRAVKSFRPDIVHSWGILSSILLAPAVLWQRLVFVNGIVADAPANMDFRNPVYRRIRFSFPYSDAVVGNSKAGLKVYRVPEKKAHCIYNGMDLGRFRNLPEREYIRNTFFPGETQPVFIVIMVAAFESRKDYGTLVTAAIRMIDSGRPFRFLLVGDGELRNETENRIPVTYKNRILFTGKRTDVEALVNASDTGVLLTNSAVHGEGISNSLLEYMANGKPVLGTRGGGTNELIEDGVTGFLLDPGNAAQVEEKLVWLYEHPEKALAMGQNGRKDIEQRFDLGQMSRRYLQLYHSLLNET